MYGKLLWGILMYAFFPMGMMQKSPPSEVQKSEFPARNHLIRPKSIQPELSDSGCKPFRGKLSLSVKKKNVLHDSAATVKMPTAFFLQDSVLKPQPAPLPPIDGFSVTAFAAGVSSVLMPLMLPLFTSFGWYAGITLLLCGIGIIFGIIGTYRTSKRNKKPRQGHTIAAIGLIGAIIGLALLPFLWLFLVVFSIFG